MACRLPGGNPYWAVHTLRVSYFAIPGTHNLKERVFIWLTVSEVRFIVGWLPKKQRKKADGGDKTDPPPGPTS